jgi:cytochrome c
MRNDRASRVNAECSVSNAGRRSSFSIWHSAFGIDMRRPRLLRLLVLAAVLGAASVLCGCRPSATSEASMITGGDSERGRSAIGKYGCAACHTIPGVRGANATVGPPLERIAVRSYLAGHLPNSPGNMIKWIQRPQEVDPKNVMPNMGVTDQDARDIAAYLYTLR